MFIIYDEDKNPLDLPKGITPLDIHISSIAKERETETIEGRNGKIDFGFTYRDREIDIEIYFRAKNTKDYRLLRDEVYSLFDEVAYISETYEKGKLYRVSVDDSYIPDRLEGNQRIATGEIKLTMPELPFSESVGTTQEIEKHGLDANDDFWQYGMGLQSIDRRLKYNHEGKRFEIYNAGDVPIHPFEQYLKITITNVRGSKDKFELHNKTTGDVFQVKEGVDISRTIVIDGAEVTRDDTQYLRKTNREYITLAKGINEFEVKGANMAKVQMDFKFYYL